jgi:hypothetical protein
MMRYRERCPKMHYKCTEMVANKPAGVKVTSCLTSAKRCCVTRKNPGYHTINIVNGSNFVLRVWIDGRPDPQAIYDDRPWPDPFRVSWSRPGRRRRGTVRRKMKKADHITRVLDVGIATTIRWEFEGTSSGGHLGPVDIMIDVL